MDTLSRTISALRRYSQLNTDLVQKRVVETPFQIYLLGFLKVKIMETEKEAIPPAVVNNSSKSTIAGKAFDVLAGDILKMQDTPKDERLAKLSTEQKNQLLEITERAIRETSGDMTELESAIGMLFLGHHYGWKVLHLLHTKKTIRKYEEILGIKIREIFPERGPSSPRSVGLYLADKASNFWKVVSGEHKIPDRRKII